MAAGFSLWDGLKISDSLLAIKVSNRESFLYIESANKAAVR